MKKRYIIIGIIIGIIIIGGIIAMIINNSKKENINQDEDKYSKGTHHAQITIKDYVLITGDKEKQENLVKEITVEISYKIGNKDKNVKISTYIAKE